ncbi:Nuclear polyadenylated RNA-binding protein nab2 [Madurella mycetomatis]|uniref:Nuclear polyadenylated RNA-binding protein nab2 n=1 Tax=Madurella mycetomatis TaxID=100816 RepID=A0A175WGB7_9PEZI|nr:Nuclear polyadenylated RNA-binding protein nab2 [Madurella mycetomatis]
MSVEVAFGTPLADALNMAIQGKIAELGWAGPGAEGAAMSEYFVLMLANGKTEAEIAGEISGDLLGLGPDDQTAPAFAKWLFEQINALSAQLGSGPSPAGDAMDGVKEDSADGGLDISMDATSDATATGLNAPTGPKAMRNGNNRGGREKRMMGQINRALDRTHDSVLHRVRPQSGNERIGRGPPAGPRMGVGRQPRTANARAANIAAGLANMGSMPGGPPAAMNGMGGMNPANGVGYMQPDIYAMMEQQNRMLQQMQQQLIMQQQNGMGPHGGHGHGNRGGRPNHFRRGGAHNQHNGHAQQQQQQQHAEAGHAQGPPQGEDTEMGQAKREAPNPDETICRFNLRCQNKDCKFAHQSPAAPPGITIDLKDICSYGAACKNRKCVGRHPSPATKTVHQGEQDCKFFPNCANPHCPFRHPTMPACRNGGECKVPNCKFTHVKTPCKYHPCTNRNCPFMHEEGQRGTFQDKVWTAEDAAKEHVSERKFVNENGNEDLVLPGTEEHHNEAGTAEVII